MLQDQEILIDDSLWNQLNQLTGNAATVCFQCGVCTAICPWGLVSQEPLSVHQILRNAQLGIQQRDENLWLCTTCAQCQSTCPRGVDIADIFRDLRTLAWDQHRAAKGLPSVLWSVYWNDNPWSQPPSHRQDWAKNLDIPYFDPEQHEILIYVGCTSSYDRRAQRIAMALVRLLRWAGVSFGYLGNDEPCCGEAVLSLGHKPFFEEIAAQTSQVFYEKGVNQLVVVSPHCYDVFKNHYQDTGIDFQPWHYTQYLAKLLKEGRLILEGGLDVRVTVQDPCYLGRHNHEYQAPRSVLEAIPGVELVEMEHNRQEALCCGGGGGRMWLDTPVGERFSDLRVREASQTNADILATACPFCIVCLEDSTKVMKLEGLRVLDISEIAIMAGDGKAGGGD
jgi:Fe-S oxidoreductase